jgi:hypothetical protein
MSWERLKLLCARWRKAIPVVLHLEVVGLAVALIIARCHNQEIRQATAEMRAAQESLDTRVGTAKKAIDEIQLSMSTQPLGGFPNFVARIVDSIDRAHKSVVVACDFPAYGEYDGKGRAIRRKIEDKITDRVPVQLTFLCPDRRTSARHAQFPEEEWNNSMKHDLLKRLEILRFLVGHGITSNTPSYSDFIHVFEKEDERFLSDFAGANIREINDDMPLLFWIADDEAVLVVQTWGGKEDSAFWTRDAHLITALRSIAERYRRSADACQPARP